MTFPIFHIFFPVNGVVLVLSSDFILSLKMSTTFPIFFLANRPLVHSADRTMDVASFKTKQKKGMRGEGGWIFSRFKVIWWRTGTRWVFSN